MPRRTLWQWIFNRDMREMNKSEEGKEKLQDELNGWNDLYTYLKNEENKYNEEKSKTLSYILDYLSDIVDNTVNKIEALNIHRSKSDKSKSRETGLHVFAEKLEGAKTYRQKFEILSHGTGTGSGSAWNSKFKDLFGRLGMIIYKDLPCAIIKSLVSGGMTSNDALNAGQKWLKYEDKEGHNSTERQLKDIFYTVEAMRLRGELISEIIRVKSQNRDTPKPVAEYEKIDTQELKSYIDTNATEGYVTEHLLNIIDLTSKNFSESKYFNSLIFPSGRNWKEKSEN